MKTSIKFKTRTDELGNTFANIDDLIPSELNNLIHSFTIDMMDIIMEHMPNVLDSISAELRQQLDKKYKCSLQGDYKNKECS